MSKATKQITSTFDMGDGTTQEVVQNLCEADYQQNIVVTHKYLQEKGIARADSHAAADIQTDSKCEHCAMGALILGR